MKELFSLIPASWKIAILACFLLALGGSFGVGYWKGHNAGYESADNKGNAAIAKLQADHSQAFAGEMARLQRKLREQAQTAMETGNALAKEKENHAKTERELRNRIARITAGSSHTFSPAFVRVWNEATGAAFAGSHAANAPGNRRATDGKAGTGKAAGAGVQRGAVTEADVLEFIIYYGRRAKDMEKQVNAWIDLAEREGWHEPR